MSHTLKPRYSDPLHNKICVIKNLIFRPFVVDFIVKSPCNSKTPVIKNKIFGPFRFVKAWSETTRKQLLMLFFFSFLGYLGSSKWMQNGTQVPQVGGTYGQMSKLKNKPLTKLVGPSF
jgi:hypothetical protein